MSDFNASEYFQIFAKVLQRGKKTPFNCYVLLSLANRIVLFLAKGAKVSEEKLERLRKFQHQTIYIRNEDKAAYFTYLDNFLKTSNGRMELQRAIANGLGAVELGLPDPDEFVLKSLRPFGGIEGLFANPAALCAVPAGTDRTTELEGAWGEIVENLKTQAEDLEEGLILRNQEAEESQQIIKNVTLRIEDELIKVEGAVGTDDFKKVLAGSLGTIKREVSELATFKPSSTGQAETFKKVLSSVNRELSGVTAGPPEAFQKTAARIREGIKIVQGFTPPTEEILVTQTLTSMIARVEKALGKPLDIAVERKITGEGDFRGAPWLIDRLADLKNRIENRPMHPTEVIAELDDLINKLKSGAPVAAGQDNPLDPSKIQDSHLENTGKADPKLIAQLKSLTDLQNKTIGDLTNKLKDTRPEFDAIKERWFTFQMMAKRKLDANDQMKARSISQSMGDFEFQVFKGLNEERKNLKRLTNELQIILERSRDVDVVKAPTAFDEDDDAIIGTKAPALTGEGEVGPGAGEQTGDDGNMATELERVLAENKVLHVQMENAQALADTTGAKVSELDGMVKSSGEYASTMETEISELTKKNEYMLEEMAELEATKRRLTESLEDANKNLYRLQVDTSTEDEKIGFFKQRVKELERSVATYQEKFGTDGNIPLEIENEFPEKARGLLMAKERHITDLNKIISRKTDEIGMQKKELEDLKTEDRKFEAERKDLGKRLEKMRVELENTRQHMKSVEIKINMSNNLLSQARKTISKLTTENEELRHDRTKYIRKTNEALAEHKSLVGQAMSLSSQVHQESQKNRSLEQQLEQTKGRERDSQRTASQLQAQLNHLEAEKKKLESEVRRNAGKGESEGLKSQLAEMEKKMEAFKKANRTLQAELVQEQKKTKELSQKLKKVS